MDPEQAYCIAKLERLSRFRVRNGTSIFGDDAGLFYFLRIAACRRSQLRRRMQWFSLGVLAGSSLDLAMRPSGGSGQPFVETAKNNWTLVVDKCFFGNDSLAKSMDSSMALSRCALAAPGPPRSKALD